jgi:hypothetical protein
MNPCSAQSVPQLSQFTREMKEFKLTRTEVLTLANIRPMSLVELMPLIEEAQDR